MISRLKDAKGSSTIFILSFGLVCILILLALFELCRIYIAREETKAAADSIALAVSQEILFLNRDGIRLLAEEIARTNNCSLSGIEAGYDEVEVSVEKKVDIAIPGIISSGKLSIVCSSSKARVIYPWDRRLGICGYYEFGYKPY